ARGDARLDECAQVQHRKQLDQGLSRGTRRKAASCCAYLHAPRAVLVDEPLTGLDPRGIRTMKQSLRDRSVGGAAIIISSHLLALVEDLCSHLLILHRGQPLFYDTISGARAAFAGAVNDSSLEEVFFRVTERTA